MTTLPLLRRQDIAAESSPPGEMLELGSSSPELHKECGRLAAGLWKINWLVGVQGHAADFVAAAIQAGHPKDRTAFFDNSAEAGKFLSKFVRSGDLVLLKASPGGVRMEKKSWNLSAALTIAGPIANLGLQPVDAGREGRN